MPPECPGLPQAPLSRRTHQRAATRLVRGQQQRQLRSLLRGSAPQLLQRLPAVLRPQLHRRPTTEHLAQARAVNLSAVQHIVEDLQDVYVNTG